MEDVCFCRRTRGENLNEGTFGGVAIGGGGAGDCNYPVLEIRSNGTTFGTTDTRCWTIFANGADLLPQFRICCPEIYK